MANLLNKKYNLELEVLTPLHVGAGQEKDLMKGVDYIIDIDSGKIFVLDHKKIAKQLSANELASFLINKNDKGLSNKLSGNLEKVSNIIFESPVNSTNDIKSFVKNGLTNKPIVPGSSIKGAIRSVLLNYFIDNKNTIDRKNKRFEEKIFGSANNGDEFMRFIKIADAQFEKTDLVNTKIFNLFGTAPNFNGGWKHEFRDGTNNKFKSNGFNTIYEIIKPSETGEFSIALSDKAFDNFYNNNGPEKKSDILHEEPSQILFSIINKHTKEYIDKQIKFFIKYPNNETPNIISSLNTVFDQIPDDNSSCVLKMSAGSGFHSITGDWQFDDFSINEVKSGRGPSRGQLNGQDSTKSRKIATNGATFDLMGFVKITVLSEELIAAREQSRKEKLAAERKAVEERLAKEKAEQDRIKAEEQAKLDTIRKLEEELIAKEKAEIERIANEKQALLDKITKDDTKRREETKKAASKGLESFCAIKKKIEFKKFKEFENIIKQYLKSVEDLNKVDKKFISDNITFIYQTSAKFEQKQFSKRYIKIIERWLGQETAQQWYSKIIKD